MKKLSALLSLALGLSLIPVVFSADKKPVPAPAAKPTAPAAKPAVPSDKPAAQAATKGATKTPAKPAAEEKKEEPLVGILIERNVGGFINLKVEDGKFVMLFLDAEKKETKANVLKATVRYRKNRADHRHLLTRTADEKSLRAPTPADRPYLYNPLYIVLFDDNEETPAEAYTKSFKQLTPQDGESVPADEMTPEQIKKVKK